MLRVCCFFPFFLCIQLLASTGHELESHRCRVRDQGLLRRLCFRAVLGAGDAVEEAGPCPSYAQAAQPRVSLHGVAAVWGCVPSPGLTEGFLGAEGWKLQAQRGPHSIPVTLARTTPISSPVSQTCLYQSGFSKKMEARDHMKIFMIKPINPKGNQP